MTTLDKIVGITGTRDAVETTALREQFESYLAPYRLSTFYLGGASGIDSLALRFLATYTLAPVIILVPNTLADQPVDAQKAVEWAAKRTKIEVRELELGPPPQCYHTRNEMIVQKSDLVIGFPRWQPTLPRDIAAHKGGTWSTLRFAESLGTPFMVIPVRTFGC